MTSQVRILLSPPIYQSWGKNSLEFIFLAEKGYFDTFMYYAGVAQLVERQPSKL